MHLAGYDKVMEIEIELYETTSGHCPLDDWFESLKKLHTLAPKFLRGSTRLKFGNFGDCKHIKGASGIYEIRIHFGPGYRIYYGIEGNKIVLLLCGGDKASQKHDIQKAMKFWNDYKELKKDNS